MQRSTGVIIAVAVGSAAIVAPIWLAIHLAWTQSLENEEARVRYNVRDVLRRSDEPRDQLGEALRDLKRANLPPCSPGEVDLMRRIDLSSSYIQAVGRIQGENLICTSLGHNRAHTARTRNADHRSRGGCAIKREDIDGQATNRWIFFSTERLCLPDSSGLAN